SGTIPSAGSYQWVRGHGRSGGIATDEEILERVHARLEARIEKALAQRVHLRVMDALSGHPQWAAVVAAKPPLELPELPVDEVAAVELLGHRALGLSGGVHRPVQLGD